MKFKEYVAIVVICVMSSMCTAYFMRENNIPRPAYASGQDSLEIFMRNIVGERVFRWPGSYQREIGTQDEIIQLLQDIKVLLQK